MYVDDLPSAFFNSKFPSGDAPSARPGAMDYVGGADRISNTIGRIYNVSWDCCDGKKRTSKVEVRVMNPSIAKN